MYRFALVLPAFFARYCLCSDAAAVFYQRNWTKIRMLPAIPVEAAKQQNPVNRPRVTAAPKGGGLSITKCSGKTATAKAKLPKEMKLTMMDFSNPDTLKDRTDGEVFYIIKNGHKTVNRRRRPPGQNRRSLGPGQLRPRLRQKKDADTKAQ